ncbi:MAG: hypothetical protein JRH06_11875 [Deltaproteobacteria bacterium]|nr:hypothetical protein [Deltaproteobacteria bacterium]
MVGSSNNARKTIRKATLLHLLLAVFGATLVAGLFLAPAPSHAQITLSVTQTAPLTVEASWTVDVPTCGPTQCFGLRLYWGDSMVPQPVSPSSGSATHIYSSAGTYTVRLVCQSEDPSPPAFCSPEQTITVTGGGGGTGAFSVTPSPPSTNTVPGQINVVPIVYTASAAGAGSYTVTSTQGQVVTQGGKVLHTVSTTVSIQIISGSGTASETLNLPARVITRALNLGENRILYRRTFTLGGNSTNTEVALQIVPPSAGPFSLVKMTLGFLKKRGGLFSQYEMTLLPGRATVPRNSTDLKAAARIIYNGSGLLRGQWKVDGQVIGYVTQYLYPGIREITIESPDVPGLPTYDTGQHSVELEIIAPAPPFDEPIIYYYVTGIGEPGGPGLPSFESINLISPEANALVTLARRGGTGPAFRWETLSPVSTYRFEIFAARTAAQRGTLPPGSGGSSGSQQPLVSADTDQGIYYLSELDMDRLEPGVEYLWRVRGFQGNNLVALSEERPVSFQAPQAEGNEPYFEYLQLIESPPETGSAPWKRWFALGPRRAFAAQVPLGETSSSGTGTAGMVELEVSEGTNVLIRAALRNPGPEEKRNIRVEFLVDGEVIDFSFIPLLAPGQLMIVETTYEVPDSYSHCVEVKAGEVSGEEVTLFAEIQGYLANEQGEQVQTPSEPPDEGYWIGAFNLKPTNITNPDPDNFSGSGTIEIPFMSEYPVEFSGLRIDEEQKRVVQGEILLPLNAREIVIGPLHAYLDSLLFTPEAATCEGVAEVPLIFSPDPIRLSLQGVTVLPEGLSGKLNLEGQASFSLTDPLDFSIILEPESYIRVSRNQVVGSSLSGAVRVPGQFLSFLGSATGIQFSGLAITLDGGFYGNATLSETKLGGTEIGVSGSVVLDFTGERSPPGLPDGFKGLYLDSGRLSFPSQVSIPDLTIGRFYVDGTGVNGQFTASNLGLDIDVGGFSGGLDSFSLGFEHNALLESFLEGSIHVPFIESDFDFRLMITSGGVEELALTLARDKNITLEALYLSLTIARGSTVGVVDGRGLADLNGFVSTLQGAPVPIGRTDFQHLLIDSLGNVDLSGGWIPLGNIDTDFNGFGFTLTSMGLGKQDERYFFGLEGGLSICPETFSLEADARIKLMAKKVGAGLVYDGVQTDKIRVDLEVPKAFSFAGEVQWYENDPQFGQGFMGDMRLSVLDALSAEATLRVGKQSSIHYWYIDAAVTPGATGIPLVPLPLSIYGFKGGAYYNMRAELDQATNQVNYSVQEGGFGLTALMTLGTSYDEGYTWHGDLGLEIVSENGVTITLGGQSWILCNLSERPSNRQAISELEITTEPFVFSGRLGIERLDLVSSISLLKIENGEIDMKIAANDWHFYVGTKQEPVQVRVLPTFINLGASGYFGIDPSGLRAGARMEVDTGRVWVFIFYGRVWGGFQGDFEVGFRPALVYAEFSVWIGLEAGVGIPDLGSFEIFKATAELNAGVRTPDPTRIWARGQLYYSILGGLYSGTWSMTFTWGDPLPPEIQPRPWPCFESIEPSEGAVLTRLDTAIKVEMTTAVDRYVIEEDSDGNKYDAIVNLRPQEFSFVDDEGNEVPYHIEWNSSTMRTAFYVVPDQFLAPNTTYNFTARARARGSL